jgi:hypothetical protein
MSQNLNDTHYHIETFKHGAISTGFRVDEDGELTPYRQFQGYIPDYAFMFYTIDELKKVIEEVEKQQEQKIPQG